MHVKRSSLLFLKKCSPENFVQSSIFNGLGTSEIKSARNRWLNRYKVWTRGRKIWEKGSVCEEDVRLVISQRIQVNMIHI